MTSFLPELALYASLMLSSCAEQLDALASQDQQSDVLRVTLTRLLGLDWVQYLEQDLDQLMMRQGSTKKIENLYVKVLELQTERDRLEEQLALLRRQLDEVNSDISSCESALAQQERILAAEGGAYAARRPVLQSRLHTIEKEVEVLSNQLHDLCADLLPFALAPELCLQLDKRLTAEVGIRRQHVIDTMLSSDEVWEGLDISQQGRRYLTQRLTEKLKSFEQLQSPDKLSIIHQLSESEHQQLRKWISQTIRDIPQQVQLLGDRLRNLKKEKRRIETDLQRAPDDEVLAPIHAEISRLRGILAEKQKRQAPLNEHIGSLQFQRDEKRRLLQEAVDQYEKVRKFEKQLKYAEQSKNVLRTYKDALTRQKLRTLEDALTTCFNKLCRKEHLLSWVNVDPEDLSIHLEGVGGILLKLSDFSAGERQLYVMSLLWALRLVSKLPLPLAIDTPLARLDETHRLRFIHDYIPQVSDQVLLFSTDAEMDSDLLAEINPQLARTYRLTYDLERGETVVFHTDTFIPDNAVLSLAYGEEVRTLGL